MGTIGIKASDAVASSQAHKAPAKRPPRNKTPVVRHSLGTGELRGVGEVKASEQHRSSGYYANRERKTASSVQANHKNSSHQRPTETENAVHPAPSDRCGTHGAVGVKRRERGGKRGHHPKILNHDHFNEEEGSQSLKENICSVISK